MCLTCHVTGAVPTQFLVGYLKSVLTKRLVVLFSLTSPIVIYVPTRASLAVIKKGLLFLWLTHLKNNLCYQTSSLLIALLVWWRTPTFSTFVRYCEKSHEDRVQRRVDQRIPGQDIGSDFDMISALQRKPDLSVCLVHHRHRKRFSFRKKFDCLSIAKW